MSAPDVFVLDDVDGHASVAPEIAADGVPVDLVQDVRDAVAGCPEMAISVTED